MTVYEVTQRQLAKVQKDALEFRRSIYPGYFEARFCKSFHLFKIV